MAIPLLLAPIVTMLAEKGLGLLSKAVDSGTDKAIDFIEEKTGLKLSEPDVVDNITAEQILALKNVEKDYELELSRLALENKKEDNRHIEVSNEAVISDKKNARDSSHLSELQTDIGKRIFIQTSIIIPLLILIDILLISLTNSLNCANVSSELTIVLSLTIIPSPSNPTFRSISLIEPQFQHLKYLPESSKAPSKLITFFLFGNDILRVFMYLLSDINIYP